jgi:hypothetical protein
MGAVLAISQKPVFDGDRMPKIVLAGQDVRLLKTRAEVLKKTGAEIVYCTGSEALQVVMSEMPALLILCHSIATDEAESIAEKVRACCPATKVLLVVSQVIAERLHEDAKFDATSLSEPSRLVTRATELLQVPFHPQDEEVARIQRPAII